MEILIVIAIIGILSSIALPMFNTHRIRAKMVEVTNTMTHLATAVNNYAQEMTAGGSVAWPNCPDITLHSIHSWAWIWGGDKDQLPHKWIKPPG